VGGGLRFSCVYVGTIRGLRIGDSFHGVGLFGAHTYEREENTYVQMGMGTSEVEVHERRERGGNNKYQLGIYKN